MDDLKKIDLTVSNEKEDLRTEPIKKSMKLKVPKKIKVILIIFVLLLVGLAIAVASPLQKTYVSAMKTYKQTKLAWEAIKKQNVQLGSEELAKTKKELIATQGNLNSLSFLKFVPIANWYYNDADHLMKAAFYGLDSAEILVDSVKPYADLLGLKGQGSFVMGSAEQRIQTAILTMSKITPRIDEVAKDLVLAQKEIDAVVPSHYPAIFGIGKIRTQLIAAQKLTDQGVTFVSEARPLIKVLPSLLGESKEKKYLILFQNDKEIRPTGGFITAYAVFRIDKGIIHVDKADDIYNLDNSLVGKKKAPDVILKYLPKVYTFNIRDSNLSPDYVESMKTFMSLYENASDKTNIDGIIALDTHVLASTIKILDDEVVAEGITFTTKPDKRCNCPQAIYQLESLTDQPKSLDLRITKLADVQAHRKDIIGVLLYSIMQKALKSSPKLYWGPLVQQMIQDTNEKHVLFYLFDKEAQKGIESLNAAGKIKKFEGDYLHINEANFGGAKANLFVKENVEQSYNIKDDGSIEKTITVNYKNPFEPSDCNLERGNLCLNGVLRDWIRVYTPKGSTYIDSKGSEVKVTSQDEFDKTVFEGFLTVRPLGAATYTLSYKLPFKLDSNSSLPLLMQKQPGTDKNEYTIKINGRLVEKFELTADKEIILHR